MVADQASIFEIKINIKHTLAVVSLFKSITVL